MVPKGFGISLVRVPVLPLPKGKEFGYVVFWRQQKEALWFDPQYDFGSTYWPVLFHEGREVALNHFDGEHPPPEKNKATWITFWSRPSRTMKKVIIDAREVAFIQDATVAGIVSLDSDDES
jgi:hypothetical protein